MPRLATRVLDGWRAMAPDQRLATATAFGLFVSMFLPWYSKTNSFVVRDTLKATETSLTAFAAFSFVEAAVLLVSAGVLVLLFARVEQRDFQLPGGDGLIVMVGGGWAGLLIFYRLLDKPGVQGTARVTATVGVKWGIFIALLLALGLVYAGARMRAAELATAVRERAGAGRGPEVGRGRETGRGPGARSDPEAGRGPGAGSDPEPGRGPGADEELVSQPGPDDDELTAPLAQARSGPATPAGAAASEPRSPSGRPRYPPAPAQQLSFEDQPPADRR